MQACAGMTAVDYNALHPLERVDGAARIVCGRRGEHTAIADLYQRAPCRVLFPQDDLGGPLCAALLTTSGGLTGGDRLAIDVLVRDGASATITTQAAEKIYRAGEGRSSITVNLDVASGAWAEWLMQETILFNGAKLARRMEANVASTGRLLAVESLVFGRSAMGEAFQHGQVHDIWRIRRDGKLIWADALRLDADAFRAMPFGLGNAAGCSTLVYVGADAARWLHVAREAIPVGGAVGGATSFDGLLILRLMADDAAVLRRGVATCVTRLRSEIAGLPPRMPRLWSI